MKKNITDINLLKKKAAAKEQQLKKEMLRSKQELKKQRMRPGRGKKVKKEKPEVREPFDIKVVRGWIEDQVEQVISL